MIQKSYSYKKHPARQITMRSTPWAQAVVEPQSPEDEAPFASLLTLHPDWPFDTLGDTNVRSREKPGDFSKVTIKNSRRKAIAKPSQRWADDIIDDHASNRVLDAQIAELSSCNRAKLYRYAAQELRSVPHFEADEGSAAWGRACRSVMRKLQARGQTLDDIEHEM